MRQAPVFTVTIIAALAFCIGASTGSITTEFRT